MWQWFEAKDFKEIIIYQEIVVSRFLQKDDYFFSKR